MRKIKHKHWDLYEPSICQKRAYMQKISSIYQSDNTANAIEIAIFTMQQDVISKIKIHT